MWPRNFEIALAAWLAVSPMVFRLDGDSALVWGIDLALATVIIIVSCLCYWPPAKRAHLVTLGLGTALALWGWLQPRPVVPEHQNHILVGILLVMFAIIPSHAARPPEAWRER